MTGMAIQVTRDEKKVHKAESVEKIIQKMGFYSSIYSVPGTSPLSLKFCDRI